MENLIIIKILLIILIILNIFFWAKKGILTLDINGWPYVGQNSYGYIYAILVFMSFIFDIIILATSLLALFNTHIDVSGLNILLFLFTAVTLRFGALMFKLGHDE